MENKKVVNIAGYRFVDLQDRDQLREPFLKRCEELHLKGTIGVRNYSTLYVTIKEGALDFIEIGRAHV